MIMPLLFIKFKPVIVHKVVLGVDCKLSNTRFDIVRGVSFQTRQRVTENH